MKLHSADLPLSTSAIAAAVSETLTSAGYTQISDALLQSAPAGSCRVFEDTYGIVAAFVYSSWPELLNRWPEAQDFVVRLISEYLGAGEAKAWDGYLLLMTPDICPDSETPQLEEILRNTTRLRKLVATGNYLRTVADVSLMLEPLVPIRALQRASAIDPALEVVAEILREKGVATTTVSTLTQAYQRREPLMERLHSETLRDVENAS